MITGPAARRALLSHRGFLEACGVAIAAAAAAEVAQPARPALALTTLNDDRQINGNLLVMPGTSPAGAGYIGIGTISPSAALEIEGNTVDPLMISAGSAADGDLFIVKATGKVGIGVTGPADKLEVAGNLKVASGELRVGNRVIATADGCLFS